MVIFNDKRTLDEQMFQILFCNEISKELHILKFLYILKYRRKIMFGDLRQKLNDVISKIFGVGK